ncbi:MAG TPA: hypothetical protein VES93_09775 [Ornithinibacter sp.]|nr:hypothetical protein [Ornithinibacter sp.]
MLFWFGVVITVVGMPTLAAVMVRLLIPGAERLRGKRALGAVVVDGGTRCQPLESCAMAVVPVVLLVKRTNL